MDNALLNEQKTDEALMEMLKSGDIAGFDLLVKRYQRPIVNYLYRLTGNFALAEDIAQDSFLILYRKAKLFYSRGCFKSWFYKIVMNLYKQELRKKKFLFGHREIVSDDIIEFQKTVKANSQSLSQKIEEKEIQSQIRQLINSLPGKQKMAVTLHIFEEFTYQEIADVLGCSIGTVKSRIHYGLQSIKEKVVRMNLLSY